MVFSSYFFVFYFFPAVLVLYYIAPQRIKNLCLALLSYFFYGWANPLFVILMITSTVIDFLCGLAIAGAATLSRRRKLFVIISICSNLSLLGFFKYFNFAYENYQALMNMIGLNGVLPAIAFKVTLPLGISFYTFQSMSYTIDVYRGRVSALTNFTDFACYVSMFPQLVAGPIIRFTEVSEQLKNRTHNLRKFARGTGFFTLGLAKKILLANPCGEIADAVFMAGSRTFLQAWYGAAAYAFQIYYDFSGYSEMAIGLGLMLGFVFPQNFNSPYRSTSITDFWRRWHISLSTWLRDYLYIPLGGNRKGVRRTYLNLLIVMILGGLWHGAAWTFLVWGIFHGLLLAVERGLGKKSAYQWLPKPVQTGLTFGAVLIGWVLFRAESMPHALNYFKDMFGLSEVQESAVLTDAVLFTPYALATMAGAVVVTWCFPSAWHWTEVLSGTKVIMLVLLLWLSIAIMTTQVYNPFIYFIF